MRFRFGDFELDAELFELRCGGTPVELQPKALALLGYLLEHRERTVGKQELLDRLWPDVTVGESSLTRAINLVRRALAESPRDGRVIRTVHARGYRIGVPVSVDTGPGRGASDFVGRELEIGREIQAAAAAGRAQFLLIAGEPGIGKTRLAEEIAAEAAEAGARVLWGRCWAGEGVPAFWPFVQMLRSYLREREPIALGVQRAEGAAEIAALIPEVRELLPELPEPEGPPDASRFRLFDGVAQLLDEGAREQPLVLVIDDLQQADVGSLQLLAFLAHGLPAARVLVLLTWREGEVGPGSALEVALAELSRGPCGRRIVTLGGLDKTGVARVVEQSSRLAARPGLVDAVYRRSEGNPLFVREIVHWLESQPGEALPELDVIPEGVRQLIRGRLADLGAPCREALDVAAVIGRDFSVAPLARVARVAEARALERIAEAERVRVVAQVPDSPGLFRFSHPLVRETLYADLSTARRARLHRAVGEALEQLYTPRPVAPTNVAVPIDGTHLAELAYHFCAAVPGAALAKALEYAVRAGDYAASMAASGAAAGHYEQALAALDASACAGEHEALRRRLEQLVSQR